jgi:hypothetical protein
MGKGYAEHYNDIRLNCAIGFITPKDMLAGHQQEIQADRGSEIGGGGGTAEESPPTGRPTDETDYFRLADHPSTTITKRVWGRRLRSLLP